MKIEWADGEKSWEKHDDINYRSQKKILEYLIKNDLIDHIPGWEWVHHYVEADKRLMPCRRAYIGSRKEIRFKFRVEVANNPKCALELNLQEGNNLWKETIKAELDQIS